MPELPEVETVCSGLREDLIGKKIVSIKKSGKRLRRPFPAGLNKIVGDKVNSISRRAKYVLINLNSGKTLIVHLGMSGRMTVTKKYEPQKHDHFIMQIGGGKTVVLNDARRFGLVELENTEHLDKSSLFNHLGAEPLDKSFNAKYLIEKLASKKVAIKLAIMDQKVVVGVGNIYASEALFYAGIDPRRAANKVKPEEVKKLVAAIKSILKKAIKAGGSTLKDYVKADGSMGYFQNTHAVYGKVGEKCKGCNCDIKKSGGIKRITQGGRSTFYCDKKQK